MGTVVEKTSSGSSAMEVSVICLTMKRICSTPSCIAEAVVSLTYDYDDKLVVMGPLSPEAEPRATDLCQKHSDIFTVPRGWELVRHLGLSS